MTVIGGEFGERGERPAPVLDIGEMSPARIAQLKMKLAEYAERDRTSGVDAYDHPGYVFFRRGRGMFQTPVLGYILDVVEDVKRDMSTTPVTVAEVAVAMERLFDIDLNASKTTSYIWNEDRPDTVRPDFETLFEKGNEYDIAFSEVYAIMHAYCIDNMQGVVGGTGLPEVPTDTAPEASSED